MDDCIPLTLVIPVVSALVSVIVYLNNRLNRLTDNVIARLERSDDERRRGATSASGG